MTTKTATPSSGSPAMNASAPATQNRSAKKWIISAARRHHAAGGRGIGSTLGPSVASRAAASLAVNPAGIAPAPIAVISTDS